MNTPITLKIDDVEYVRKDMVEKEKTSGDFRIIVLPQGWVVVGEYDKVENSLKNASVIRNWGTTKGLGEIAISGPTTKTILDFCGTINLAGREIFSINCVAAKWCVKC
jgi:hypothetical protein